MTAMVELQTAKPHSECSISFSYPAVSLIPGQAGCRPLLRFGLPAPAWSFIPRTLECRSLIAPSTPLKLPLDNRHFC